MRSGRTGAIARRYQTTSNGRPSRASAGPWTSQRKPRAPSSTEPACRVGKSAPFHSSLLKPASDRLRDYMENIVFSAPQIDLINNVDVAILHDPAAIKDALVRQAAGPVRWVETMQKMAAEGVTQVIECAPSKTLIGMAKRIDAALVGEALVDQAALERVLASIKA